MSNSKFILAAAISGLVLAGCASGSKSADSSVAQGECHGINSCKAQGDCGGDGHACAGKNSCKGMGWKKLSKNECDAKNGKFKASM